MSFKKLGLNSNLLDALTAFGYKKPYPIQKELIPFVLDAKDVLGIAKTGSGKTASFVLPIIHNLQGKTKPENRHINVLVLVPTRELAVQVQEVFFKFGKDMPDRIKSLAVYGGVSINPQMQNLQNVNVLVATPGRLLELAESNAVKLSSISSLILDEADKMLNLGFKDEMDRIFGLLPKKRQNLLFSATLSPEIEALKSVTLKDPKIVKIESEEQDIELIEQTGYFVAEDKKGPLLRHLITSKNLRQVLVFTSSIYKADNVADKLRKNGINAQAVHGKKGQMKRLNNLADFKEGRLKVLVATDLLARGIDIAFLPCVINYELPRSPKDFVHRIGRTGRAENPGLALTFVSPEEQHHFKVIQKKMKKIVTMIESENIL
ncbi:MAG: DEAD/DEAH box helicase [Crocinitomicaceae bacterium]